MRMPLTYKFMSALFIALRRSLKWWQGIQLSAWQDVKVQPAKIYLAIHTLACWNILTPGDNLTNWI